MSWRSAAAVVLLLQLLLVALAATRLPKLRIRVLDEEFLPASSEVLAVDAETRRLFGSDERFFLAFEGVDTAFGDELWLSDFRRFRNVLLERRNLQTLLLDRVDRARPMPPDRRDEPFLLAPPDQAWLDAARRQTRSFRHLAVSASGRAGFLEFPALSATGVSTLVERIAEAQERLLAETGRAYEVRLLGRQIVLNGLGQAIFEDLRTLLPWCFAVLFAVLALCLRSLTLSLLAMAEVGLAVVSTLALQQLLGFDISLMTALVPVLVTTLGVADEVHLVGEVFRQRELHPRAGRPAWVGGAVGRVFFPVTATTLTTVIGLLSFFATDIPALRAFGLVAGLGVVLSWFFTLTFVPAMLLWLPWGRGPRWAREGRGLSLPRRSLPVIALLALLLVPWGLTRLAVDDGWTRNFAPDHEIVRNVAWFQQESTGLYPFDIVLERADGRPWTDPEALTDLDRWRRELEADTAFRVGFSVVDLLRDRGWELAILSGSSEIPTASPATASPATAAAAVPRPEIPDDPALIGLWRDTFRLFNEEVFWRSFVTADARVTRLILFSAGDDYATTSRARAAIDRLFEDFPGRVAVGGSAERGRTLIAAVVSTQGRSILAALALSIVALGLASGRWRRSLLSVAATAAALAATLALAGWAGLELGVASSCFLALGFGVGLDYAIHLAFADHRGRLGAVRRRVAVNVLVVGAGLAVLMLSSNPTIAKLGFLLVASMATAGLAALAAFREA